MRSRRYWIIAGIALVFALPCFKGLACDPNDFNTVLEVVKLEKTSDTELYVEVRIMPGTDGTDPSSWKQAFWSDGWIDEASPTVSEWSHTFTDVTIDSFPLWLDVVFLWSQTCHYTKTVSFDSARDQFMPEISLIADGELIPDGGLHEVDGPKESGFLWLEYTVDNTNGVGNLVVEEVTASSFANCRRFSVNTPLPLVIGVGEREMLRVSVTLDDPGAFGFALAISSNDPDVDPYSFDVSGTVMTAEQAALGGATRQLVPMGQGGEAVFLDCPPVLDDAGDPVMVGYLPLAGVYGVGETVTGAAMVCDAAGTALRSAWVYAHAYAVDLETRPPNSELIQTWMIRFDPVSGCYPLSRNTEGMAPGIYDIYLSIGSRGAGQTLRIRLEDPEA